MQTTNPSSAGPLGILILFLAMYVLALGILTYLLLFGARIIARIGSMVKTSRPLEELSLLHAYYYASVLSLAPIMFIGMKSVGALGVIEVLLVVVFIVAACIYIRKRV